MAQLIIVEGPLRGQTFDLAEPSTLLGRASSNTVVLSDRRVADHHAEIRQQPNGFLVRSLDKKRTLLLNGEAVREAELSHGDWITIADTALVFSEDGGSPDPTRTDLEIHAIDPDELLTSQIRSRQPQFQDAESVIETLDLQTDTDQRLATLFKVSHAIGEVLEKKRLMTKIVDVVFDLFRADRCFAMVLDESKRKLRPMASKARDQESGKISHEGVPHTSQISRTILREVLQGREAVLCTDAQDDARFLSGQSIVDQGLRSFMCVPFVHRGKVTGLIQVNSSSEARPYDKDDLALLSAVSMQAAVALENAHAYQKRREHNFTLRHLNRATQRISSYLERHKILEEMVKASGAILRCTKASVLLLEHGRLKLDMAMGFTRELKASIPKAEMGQRFCRQVIKSGKPLLVSDVEKELGNPPNPRYRTKSFLIVPVTSRTLSQEEGDTPPCGVVCVTDKLDGSSFDGNDSEVLSILAGQTGIALANAELYERATVDTLTNVFVRRHFFQRLDDAIIRAKTRQESLAVLMVDVDHFKKTNDTYGHPVGDRVLSKIGSILKKAVRPDDTVARYGGEEFTVILPNTDAALAAKIAERVRGTFESEQIRLPADLITTELRHKYQPGEQFNVGKTASIGIGMIDPSDGRESLIKKADMACYSAKKNGRNRVEVCNDLGEGTDSWRGRLDETGALSTDPGA